jgi:NAD+--dinitrogen-reductase ADP-D-ribosyltransferase
LLGSIGNKARIPCTDTNSQFPHRMPRPWPRTPPHGRPTLPRNARLPINRCNLPAIILGSLTYQLHPVPLEIDGIHPLHEDLFDVLAGIGSHSERAKRFIDYMSVHFRLDQLDQAGLEPGREKKRANANYLRMVRGWSFDAQGREGAVLKSWVETRFGLLALHHAGPLGDSDSDARHAYLRQAAAGIYGTNAIEAQLDLLYTYCQYELSRQHPGALQLTLYRGINRIDENEVLERLDRHRFRVLFNNLNSFSANRERADEFGDYILEVRVPLPKIFFFNLLLSGILKGEAEFVVIGGVYEVEITSL